MQWVIDENELNQDFYVQDTLEEPDENIDEIMDEEHQETIKRLSEIGISDDYFGLIDAVFLEEIAQLPILNRDQQNVFYDEVNNLNDGMSFFQDLTNELIRQIIERYG